MRRIALAASCRLLKRRIGKAALGRPSSSVRRGHLSYCTCALPGAKPRPMGFVFVVDAVGTELVGTLVGAGS